MSRFWTCHWQYRFWRNDINPEFEPICDSGSNKFSERGVSVGDSVYVVSLNAGQLYLGGRMVVKAIVSRPEAARIMGKGNLFETADEWIIDPDRTGTLLHLHRRLSPALTKRLRFILKSGPSEPVFISETELDNQATRGVREITPESAALLDKIIHVTDRLPRSDQLVTVTEDFLLNETALDESSRIALPEEVPSGAVYSEGSVERVLVNRYERDPKARDVCIRHYGTRCFLCDFDFVAVYGEVMADFIHVHHLRLLSTLGADYRVDPIQDLRPVCPNCHAVLHRRQPPYSLEEVRHFLETHR